MGRQDIRPVERPELRWDADNCQESLGAVYRHAEGHALNAIGWYLNSKRAKKRWAQCLRLGAIGATAVAGILPIVSQICRTGTSQCVIDQPAWASVALGLAALFVGIDRFFGYSTAWMRFITTEHQIRQILHEFQLDYYVERASWQGNPPAPEQVLKILNRCKAFLVQVDEIVRKETDQWLVEFQDVLKQVDEAARAKAALVEQGGINLTVSNGDQVAGGWQVSVDGGPKRAYSGTGAALPHLTPGMHMVRLEGEIDGAQKVAEKVVLVTGGKITEETLTL